MSRLFCCCSSKGQGTKVEAKSVSVPEVKREPSGIETALKASFNMFQAYDLLPTAILLLSIGTKEEPHCIRYMNKAAIFLTGYTDNELENKSINLLMTDITAAQHDAFVAKWKMVKTRADLSFSENVSTPSVQETTRLKETKEQAMQHQGVRAQQTPITIKCKSGALVQVWMQMNIFTLNKVVFAVCALSKAEPLHSYSFEDVLFHIVLSSSGMGSTPSTTPQNRKHRKTSDTPSLSVLEDEDTLTPLPSIAGAKPLARPLHIESHVYVQPPHKKEDFMHLSKWTFEPGDVAVESKQECVRLIKEHWHKAEELVAQEQELLHMLTSAEGYPLHERDLLRAKHATIKQFNHQNKKMECLLVMK